MANFPASLDSLSNPTATTRRNDPGFELHSVISTLNDIVELLESKLGITDSPSGDAPVANRVLGSLASGKSAWRQLATPDVAANAITQVAGVTGTTSNPTLTAAAGTVVLNEMTVPITTVGGDLLVWFYGNFSHSVAGSAVNTYLKLDAGPDLANSVVHFPAASQFVCISSIMVFSGVSAGPHNVYVRWNTSANTATAAATNRILMVMERKK